MQDNSLTIELYLEALQLAQIGFFNFINLCYETNEETSEKVQEMANAQQLVVDVCYRELESEVVTAFINEQYPFHRFAKKASILAFISSFDLVNLGPITRARIDDATPDFDALKWKTDRLLEELEFAIRDYKMKSPDSQTPKTARLEVQASRIRIDAVWYSFKGGTKVCEKLTEFFREMIEEYDYISMTKHGLRTRDIEKQPEEIQALIESQPSTGCRILKGWFN